MSATGYFPRNMRRVPSRSCICSAVMWKNKQSCVGAFLPSPPNCWRQNVFIKGTTSVCITYINTYTHTHSFDVHFSKPTNSLSHPHPQGALAEHFPLLINITLHLLDIFSLVVRNKNLETSEHLALHFCFTFKTLFIQVEHFLSHQRHNVTHETHKKYNTDKQTLLLKSMLLTFWELFFLYKVVRQT